MYNILFISHTLGMDGGANRSMLQLILELRDKYSINPLVLIPKGKKRLNDNGLDVECRKNRIQYIQTIIPWTRHSKIWLHRMKYIISMASYPLLVKQIKKHNINLIHSNGSVFELGGLLSRSLNIPHVWHLREFGNENINTIPIWGESYYKNTFRNGDVFIAISDAIKHSYVNYIPENKICRIYNGISELKYKKKASHKNEICQFVMVGLLTQHKNQLDALIAADILKKRGCSKFHISFAGSSNAVYLDDINTFIEEHELQENITLLGLCNDVPELLSKMDVGLMLSRTEAFGRVTVEYMFQNLAVIASDTGANPEIIEDGKTGLLYHFGNAEMLADKMQMFICNHEEMVRIAESGNKYAHLLFPSEKNTNAVFELYNNLLK